MIRRSTRIVAKATIESVDTRPSLPLLKKRKTAHKRLASVSVSDKPPASFPHSRKYVGAHVSAAGGLHNAFIQAREIQANAFAMFMKPRKWSYTDLTPTDIATFKQSLKDSGISAKHILPHGQYIVNLGHPDPEKRAKAFAYVLDDLKRCDALGLTLYNFHPGSGVGLCSQAEAIQHIAEGLNKALKETQHVRIVLETMAGQGAMVGSTFESLREVLDLVSEEWRHRVGVCLDTCHLFAAGYDIRTKAGFEATLQQFDRILGLHTLMGVHLNDSQGELGCRKDRHANLGQGQMGLDVFRFIMTDDRFDDMPLILETPIQNGNLSVWQHEIAMLRDFEQRKE